MDLTLLRKVYSAYNPPTAQFLRAQIMRPIDDLDAQLRQLLKDASVLAGVASEHAVHYAMLEKYAGDDAPRESLAKELGIDVEELRGKLVGKMQRALNRLLECWYVFCS
jgi:hypothetical protein